MNKKVFIFVEDVLTSKVTKVDLPDDFDANMGNFIAKLACEFGLDHRYYVGGLA